MGLSTTTSINTGTTLSYISPAAELVSHCKLEAALSTVHCVLCSPPPFCHAVITKQVWNGPFDPTSAQATQGAHVGRIYSSG